LLACLWYNMPLDDLIVLSLPQTPIVHSLFCKLEPASFQARQITEETSHYQCFRHDTGGCFLVAAP
jgi:hypothetical protein